MRYFLLLIGLLLGLSVSAQTSIVDELQKNRVGQGTVTIHQDAKISALLGSVYVKNEDEEPKVLKARGYRVQVYAGNNSRIARQEANDVAEQITAEFPELSVYADKVIHILDGKIDKITVNKKDETEKESETK